MYVCVCVGNVEILTFKACPLCHNYCLWCMVLYIMAIVRVAKQREMKQCDQNNVDRTYVHNI